MLLYLVTDFSWLLTGIYIRRANGAFEDLNEEIIAEARK